MENNTPNTNNFLNWVEIKNFKSIKDLRLDCKRVNVFIGKPNVGKSNILEGLGLLGAGYSRGRIFQDSVRYDDIEQLYWDFDIASPIEITTNKQKMSVSRWPTLYGIASDGIAKTAINNYEFDGGGDAKRFIDELGNSSKGITSIDQKDSERRKNFDDRFIMIKKFDFKNLTQFIDSFQDYLLPPNGSNLYAVIRRNRELWSEFAKLFIEQQLELVLFDQKQEFILQKKDGPFVVQYPFFSIADTFRRFMFYITAIESNKNSVIVFEEPEVHSFPPYTQEMAYRMIYDEDNRYFISTHSPYLLHPFIENMDYDELNVFVTYYQDYQTKVRALNKEEFRDILDYSTNIFFNLDRFTPDVPTNTIAS